MPVKLDGIAYKVLLWIGFFGVLAYALTGWIVQGPPLAWPVRVGIGESLLHGLPVHNIALAMPLSSVLESLYHVHVSAAFRQPVLYALLAASLLVVFALGRTLHSGLCGLTAAAYAAYAHLLDFVDALEHSAYNLTFLLVAFFLFRRARTRRDTVWLALALTVSLYLRSPLFLFPPVLLIFDRIRAKVPSTVTESRPLWLIPLLALLPWAWMNYAVFSRFVPFENARAVPNVVMGALGVVASAVDADFTRVGLENAGDLYLWAAKEIAAHPLRYLIGMLGRLRFAFGLHPVLTALAALALWRSRKKKGFSELGLLCAYFLLIYSLVGVLPRYFAPLWPVAAVLAFSAVLDILRVGAQTEDARWPLNTARALSTGFFLLSSGALALVLRYPGRLSDPRDAFETLDLQKPPDLWLLEERARHRMRQGETQSALQDFTLALKIDPNPRRELDFAEAHLAAATKAQNLVFRPRLEDPARPARAEYLKAIAFLLRAQNKSASAAFSSALSFKDKCTVTGTESNRAREIEERVCHEESALSEDILETLEFWPHERRDAVLRSIEAADWTNPPLLLRAAQAAAEAGDKKRALSVLKRLEGPQLNPKWRSDVAKIYGLIGDPAKSSKSLQALFDARKNSRLAKDWISLANSAQAAGDIDRAALAVQKAEGLNLNQDQVVELALIYTELHRPRQALSLLETALERRPKSAELLIARAFASKRNGDSQLAVKSLQEALGLYPAPPLRLRIAQLYLDWNDCPSAVKILTPLAGESSVGALALRDIGICRFQSGDFKGAAADLRLAVKKDPRLLSAYLSLGTVLSSLGQDREAASAYVRALALPERPEEESVRALIRRELKNIRNR